MPLEHRFIAALILLGGNAATVLGAWGELGVPSLVVVAVCVVAGGLLLPAPRMVNAVAAMIGGSLVAISAMLDGEGTSFVLVLPIAAASVLLLGAPGFGWTVVLSVLPVALVDADRLGTAALASPVDVWAGIVLVGWLAWLGLHAAIALRRRRYRARAAVLLGMNGVAAAVLVLVPPTNGVALVTLGGWFALCHSWTPPSGVAEDVARPFRRAGERSRETIPAVASCPDRRSISPLPRVADVRAARNDA